jgi:hypothetical protein
MLFNSRKYLNLRILDFGRMNLVME